MLIHKFYADETGFIISAELILIATILVIGMIVGLSEVQHAVTQELNDVGDALGSVNQTFAYSGFRAYKSFGNGWGIKSLSTGSVFVDLGDDCDNNQCTISCEPASSEIAKGSCDRVSSDSTTCSNSVGRTHSYSDHSGHLQPAACQPIHD